MKPETEKEPKSSDKRGWLILIGLSFFSSITSSVSGSIIFISMMVAITVALVVGYLWYDNRQKNELADEYRPRKRKNSDAELDPMGLLTDDDREELRQALKDEIRTRITSGSDGELSTLDALLADPDTSRKMAKK